MKKILGIILIVILVIVVIYGGIELLYYIATDGTECCSCGDKPGEMVLNVCCECRYNIIEKLEVSLRILTN